jgi:hypothetical protein
MSTRLHLVVVLSLVLFTAAIVGIRASPSLPPAMQASAETATDPEEYIYERLRNNGQVQIPGQPITIYVQKLQGRTLVKPVLKRTNAHGQVDWVARARDGEIKVSSDKKRLLLHLHQVKGASADGSEAFFVERHLEFDLPKASTP